MDAKILDKISEIVAAALNGNDLANVAGKLDAVIPENIARADRAAALGQAYVYSLICEQPGYAPDGRPGFLPATADLKAAVLNEIAAMIEADFDKGEHRATWQAIKESVDATPEADFLPGVAVNCPDDYLLSLDRISCADMLKQKNALPAWAEPYQG